MGEVDVQKEVIRDMIDTFSSKKLDPNDTIAITRVKRNLVKFIRDDLRQSKIKNHVNIGLINDIKSPSCGSKVGSALDKNGDLQTVLLRLNLASLYDGQATELDKKTRVVTKRTGGIKSDDKRVRVEACLGMLETIYHELTHVKQEIIAASNISNPDALKFARELVLSMHLDGFYKSNYKNLSIETDARISGKKRLIEKLEEKDFQYLDKNSYHERIFYDSFLDVSTSLRKTADSRYVDRGDFISKEVDEAIKERPEYLNIYPILQKEYNLDGTKKDAKTMIINMKQELKDIKEDTQTPKELQTRRFKDCKKMYVQIITEPLLKSESEQIDDIVKTIGVEGCTILFAEIKNEMSRSSGNKLFAIETTKSSFEKALKRERLSGKETKGHLEVFARWKSMHEEKLLNQIKINNEIIDSIIDRINVEPVENNKKNKSNMREDLKSQVANEDTEKDKTPEKIQSKKMDKNMPVFSEI